ncbi:embryonic protein UVS.2-like [Dendropsophus ebraccatus]|uniref:embryonic protein UVS.2-like n=1 Tax=Dendropsophus ebraccatus TaxID=150705 RepID=UPI003830FF43
MAVAVPRYSVPSHHYFSWCAVPALHQHVPDNVIHAMTNTVSDKVHLTTDTWTSSGWQEHYISLTVHRVNLVEAGTESDPENILHAIKKVEKSGPVVDGDDIEEPQGIFSQILKANKDITLAVREGDILIPPDRSAIKCTQCLWPKSASGTVNVPYAFAFNYSDLQRNLFKTSMEEYQSLTCIRFVNRTTEDNFLNIMAAQGCVASLGRVGGGQLVGLSPTGCIYRGIIQHELNHALGFYHEHMRSDRDDYVTIMYQNIPEDHLGDFNKANTNNLGLKYDYGSVMHYDKYAFTNTSGQPTILPKPDPNVPIGQRDGLSPLDVAKINRLYQCNVCSNLLNEKNGNLTSANYPSAYPHNVNCVWLIRIPSGQVALNFVDFDVQSSPGCKSDYIRIYDGPTKDYPLLLDRTCGTELIPPVSSSTNQLLLEFSSDRSIAGKGFKALYSTARCGKAFNTPNGTVTSPGYPNNYTPNLDCDYTITVPVGYRIVLTIRDFDTESSPSCKYDYLEMQSGTTKYAPLCGEKKNVPVIKSTTNILKLHFVSDGSIQKKGFMASYVMVVSLLPTFPTTTVTSESEIGLALETSISSVGDKAMPSSAPLRSVLARPETPMHHLLETKPFEQQPL